METTETVRDEREGPASRLLRALHRGGYRYLLALRAGKTEEAASFQAENLGLAGQFARRHAGADLYHGVAERADGKRRGADGLLALRALFADFDYKDHPGGREDVVRRLGGFPRPSAVVSSGGGLHAYWFLQRPIELRDPASLSRARAMLRAIARHLGADMRSAEPARILRLPGTLNHKYDPPRPVELETLEPDLLYSDELTAGLPAEPEQGPTGAGEPLEHGLTPETREARAVDFLRRQPPAIQGDGGDARTFSVACAVVVGHDLPVERALAVMAEWNARCLPPWSERELREKLTNAEHYGLERRGGRLAEDPGLSEDALALAFTDRHRDDLLYVDQWGAWLRWDGARWLQERTLLAFDLARDMVRELARDVRGARSAKTVNAVARLASMDRAHARTPDAFDRWPMLLNVPAGTLDLRTGKLRAHDRADAITKVCPVSPGAAEPRKWLEALDLWTRGDAELAGFLRRLVGYLLTGSVREEVLPFVFGPGGNGKSRFIEAVRSILGTDYMTNVAMETIVETRNEQHPTDIAGLRGMRVAVAIETEAGRQLAEAKVKQLTGGDRLRARFMRQDFFEFDPTHKLVIVGNHKPRLANLDDAIRRRVLLVPFDAEIPEHLRDRDLADKLRGEAPGIMSWAVAGCLEWQRDGLRPPQAVRAATEAYFTEQDDFAEWLAERAILDGGARVKRADAHQDWMEWARSRDLLTRTPQWFYERVARLNRVEVTKSNGHKWFRGLGLKAKDEGKREGASEI